jgi:hypothetical protein
MQFWWRPEEKKISLPKTKLISIFPVSKERDIHIGLDAETLYWGDDGSLPRQQLALCFSFGTPERIRHVVATAPGRFNTADLTMLAAQLSQEDVVVVGHNALKFDLPLLNGTLVYNGLEPLPPLRCIDTLGDLKHGMAFSRSLRALCRRYKIQLKEDSPDWRKVLEGDQAEWKRMVSYCDNDVQCALELEQALAKAGIPSPTRTWNPKRGM